MTKITHALMASALTLFAQSAYADSSAGFTAELELELSGSSTFNAPSAAAEINDIYVMATLGLEWALGGGFAIFSELTLEPVLDPVDDRFFEDGGIYMNEIGLSFSNDSLIISAGKISPAFAMAWDEVPGFFGVDLAEDYELSEAIGGAFEIPFSFGGGEHSIITSVFYADTTVLSDSIGTKRGRTALADGGAGNTEKLDNFAVQLAGSFNATGYNLSFRQLSAGQGDVSDEIGASFALQHSLDVNGNVLTFLGEIARFEGFGGTADNVTYATLSAAYTLGKLTFSTSYTGRNSVGRFADQLTSIGIDYDFGNDFVASFGLNEFQEAGATSNTVALSVVKVFSFGS
jgi:hypothetical protein